MHTYLDLGIHPPMLFMRCSAFDRCPPWQGTKWVLILYREAGGGVRDPLDAHRGSEVFSHVFLDDFRGKHVHDFLGFFKPHFFWHFLLSGGRVGQMKTPHIVPCSLMIASFWFVLPQTSCCDAGPCLRPAHWGTLWAAEHHMAAWSGVFAIPRTLIVQEGGYDLSGQIRSPGTIFLGYLL